MSRVDRHIRRGHPITFGLIVLFGIIELSISAWLVSRYDVHHNFPSTSVRDRTSFLLFTSIWTVLFSAIYMILFWHSPDGSMLTSVASHGIYLFITWVFWTAGAASITAGLNGGLDCSGDNGISYCGQLNALEAFAWIEWILVTFALFAVLLRGISVARRGDGLGGQLV